VEVTVVDLDPAKLEQAKEVGATHVIDARATDVAKQIKRATRGGAEAVVDFVGSEESATLGVRALAKRGVLVVVGLFGGAVTVPLPLFSLKHISILGSALGSLEEMGELMDLARSGAVAPIPVAVRPMSTVQHALEDLQQGRVMGRVVLTQQMETTA
jgi:D-arabinose 1-dehydrogenase-like Zn-dependent alcohol dehydrogenase